MTKSLRKIVLWLMAVTWCNAAGQVNAEQVMRIGRNTLYFEDYVLSIQYFNQAINAKPYLAQPYFLRSVAKLNLEDYRGAELDATKAIERNPFLPDAFEVRGVARQNMGKYTEAIADYDKALEQLPLNKSLMYNKAWAQHDASMPDSAKATFNTLIKEYPGFDAAYIGRARVNLEQTDTTNAIADINKALGINRNAVNAYLLRADINISRGDSMQNALSDMNEAIRLQPKHAGFYVNRAYVRYRLNDYYGAMADFDHAIQLDPDNTAAIFNRGMLRAEVRDFNHAIDDLNLVLAIEPMNYKALYNRAILLGEIGQTEAAMADLDRVTEGFPDFAAAYFLKYDILRRSGQMTAAQKNYDKSMALAKTAVTTTRDETPFPVVENNSDTQHPQDSRTESQEEVKRRFESLTTVAANTHDEPSYNNKDIRGRVQDRDVNIELEPMFAVTYYTSPTELKQSGDYIREVDDLNYTRALKFLLQVTNHQPSMTDEDAAQAHFANIDYYNSYLATHSPRAVDYFGRAMDQMMLRNYAAAITDLDRAIALTPHFTLAYLVRATARYDDLRSQRRHSESSQAALAAQSQRIELQSVLDDLDRVIALSPQMAIARYNKGVVLAHSGDYAGAIDAFSQAIDLKPDLGEAYYNRGYCHLQTGNRTSGVSDISKAGELGIVPSYNLLKRINR